VPDSAAGVPAPNIPPAPTLPRFLDKLILNVRPTAVVPVPVRAREREREREKEGGRGGSRKMKGGALGMTGSGAGAEGNMVAVAGAGAMVPARTRLYAPGMADDTSVLPVPSHVVLHHLSTSAIRNGVLAVGNTTRYRKKVRTLSFCFLIGFKC
jgi:5'-AMP-activated protein kinase beta subunit, interaction domain